MTADPKQGEREYFARIGAAGIAHSLAKPYADDNCAQYLAVMTALFGLLCAGVRQANISRFFQSVLVKLASL